MGLLQQIIDYLHQNAGLLVARGATAFVTFAVIYGLAIVIARFVERTLKNKSARGATLATIVRSVIALSGLVAALVMGLSQLGINIATVLAGAGVIGLAIGFGAQTLVKDCISGFFLILDDVVEVGDRVEVNGTTGVIEKVGLRITTLRADTGQLWYIPNGAIEKVGNFNRDWNRAEVKVGLAYEASVAEALKVLDEVGQTWAKEHSDISVAAPMAQGIMELADSSVVLRLVARTSPMKMDEVARELRRRIKEAFDEAGLELAYPRQVSIDGGSLNGGSEKEPPKGEEARASAPDASSKAAEKEADQGPKEASKDRA